MRLFGIRHLQVHYQCYFRKISKLLENIVNATVSHAPYCSQSDLHLQSKKRVPSGWGRGKRRRRSFVAPGFSLYLSVAVKKPKVELKLLSQRQVFVTSPSLAPCSSLANLLTFLGRLLPAFLLDSPSIGFTHQRLSIPQRCPIITY